MSPAHQLAQVAEALEVTVARSAVEDGEGGLELDCGHDTARALLEELAIRGLQVLPIKPAEAPRRE